MGEGGGKEERKEKEEKEGQGREREKMLEEGGSGGQEECFKTQGSSYQYYSLIQKAR